MTLLSFMFLILKTNQTLSCFTRLISLHNYFIIILNSMNEKSICFQNFSYNFSFVILNFQLKWLARYQNKQKTQVAILPKVFSSKTLYIILPKYIKHTKNVLMCAVLKEENRCLIICVISLAQRSDVLERSKFQKPSVTSDCPVQTWLFLMRNIFHAGLTAEEL